MKRILVLCPQEESVTSFQPHYQFGLGVPLLEGEPPYQASSPRHIRRDRVGVLLSRHDISGQRACSSDSNI